MATQFEIDYALMAGASYISTRPDINKFPIPADWATIPSSHFNDSSTGFEAVAFQKGTDIVISYAGTYDKDYFGDMVADVGLATGLGSDQLLQAAEYYLQVKAANPGATITFTGHSLGGGLAALMGVFFNQTAVTFDQAPFLNSAKQSIAMDILAYLTPKFPAATYPLISSWLSPLTRFIAPVDLLADTLPARTAKVTGLNTQGEFLSVSPLTLFDKIGAQTPLEHGPTNVAGTDLHAQSLLTAFLQSDQTATTNATTNVKETLSQVTYKLTDLLGMIFDKKLYSFDTDKGDENFLERLVRHEAGNAPGVTTADAMVTRFTRDLWKLAQDGGLTLNDGNGLPTTYSNWNNISKTLTAFAMQMYYEDTANATNASKELFTQVTGGVQFDMADVSKTFQAAFDANEKLNLNDAKGYKEYFAAYLSDNPHAFFTPEERGIITSLLPYLRDWYVQAGAVGLNATDANNRGAFMLGGNGADQMTGGTAADLLVGNAGDDTLQGGLGNDTLLGGTGTDTLNGGDGVDLLLGGQGDDTLDGNEGNDILKGGEGTDTYAFTGSYGTDIITDSDGSGTITIAGQTLNSATQKFESIYQNETSGHTIIRLNGGNSLAILKENAPNRILVNDWSEARNLGISLQGNTPTAPAATHTGDFKKKIDAHGTPDTTDDSYVMTDGNYTPDPDAPDGEANALDLISGTAGNDAIDGKGGDDALSGMAGDDHIEGGDGSDEIQGGLGKDTINGGAGDDSIYGSSDDAIIKPTDVDFAKPINTYTHPQATGFNWTSGYNATFANGVPLGYSDAPRNRLEGDQGNLIDGGAGNDFIAAGTGADYVHGGADKDFIFGMDKDDVLFGDGGNDRIYGDGDKPDGISVVWALPENHGNDIIDGGDGDDYLLGQGKDDIIFGGKDNDKIWGDDVTVADLDPTYNGNDYLDGGDGNDQIVGGGKDDTLIGGDGNDSLWGDNDETNLPEQYHGNDFLYGGIGSDQLVGGAGNDYLEGGTGDDTIWGGTGKDIYIYNAGDGVDAIYDTKAENNIIRFGAGINKDNIKLHLGSFMLDLGNGDAIHIGDFDQTDVFNSSSISSFEFADGSSLTTTELLARGFDLDGTAGDDTIIGTNTTDRINGYGGNDTLYGNEGGDILIGGGGSDTLYGKEGKDTYQFNRGDGADIIIDAQSDSNVLRFGAGISVSDITFRLGSIIPNSLMLDLGNGDAVHIDGFDQNNVFSGSSISSFEFSDGSVLTTAELLARGFDLDGTAGDDQIIGTNTTDRINGFDGNDILNGGGGADILQGGDGEDIYRMDYGMGRDTLIDTSAEGSVLALGNGITFDDLEARREGDSLSILLRGSSDRVLVKDYYTQPQTWTVRNATGGIETPETLVATTVLAEQNARENLKQSFLAELKHQWVTGYLQHGYTINPDGSMFNRYVNNFNADVTKGTQTDTEVWSYFPQYYNGATNTYVRTYSLDNVDYNNWYGSQGSKTDVTATLGKTSVASDEAWIVAPASTQTTYFTEYQTTDIGWDVTYGPAQNSTWSSSRYIYGQDPNSYGWVAIGTINTTSVQQYSNGTAIGRHAAPGTGYSPLGSLPTTAQIQVNTQTHTRTLHEIIAGPGDNEIDGGDVVDAGAGNDVVYAGVYNNEVYGNIVTPSLVLGGEGNDSIYGYGRLYGESGDDWIESSGFYDYSTDGSLLDGGSGNDSLFGDRGADQLNGGSGSDFMDGYFGADSYFVSRDDVGFDLIADSGISMGYHSDFGDYSLYMDWYYSSLGRSDWMWPEGALPPLPPISPNDYAALAPLYAAGVIEQDTVEFGAGIVLADLSFSWGAYRSDLPRVTLDISWGADRGIRVLIPRSEEGGDWSSIQGVDAYVGGSLGMGIERFSFADGTILSMAEMMGLAPPPPSFDPPASVVFHSEFGSGTQVVSDPAVDTIEFGTGITPEMLSLGLGSMLIRIGTSGDEIHLTQFDPNDALSSHVQSYTFADGSILTHAELVARGFDLFGTDADETIQGTNVTDRITGIGGNDTLIGGAGSDTYLFDAGSGQDRVFDYDPTLSDTDTLQFGAGINPQDIRVEKQAQDLVLRIAGQGDAITLENWFLPEYRIEQALFSDGTIWDVATLEDRINDAPIVANALSDLGATEDQPFTFTVPTTTFNDDDFIHGDTLAYSATLADGTALPVWLTFDSATRSFSGTPLNADVGSLNLAVAATDTGGLTASSLFTLSVANVNDSPTAADDAGAAQEDGGAVTLSAASLLFNDTDPDIGDTLNIVGVTQADSGAAVSLVPSTSSGQVRDVQYDIGSLYQSLGAGQTATDTFSYTIADAEGATSTANVEITVTGVNDAPVTAADTAAVQENNVLTATGNVLSNDTDVDAGTVLTVADAASRSGTYGSLSLAADGSYSYALDNDAAAVQSLAEGETAFDSFAYLASDGVSTTSEVLTVAISGQNDIPVLTTPLPDKQLARNTDVRWTIPADSFTDIDRNDTLSYSAQLADGSALPGWLMFDAATQTFSGHVPKGAKGSMDIQVVAGDGHGTQSVASDVFQVSITNGQCGGHGNEGVGNGQDAPPPGHDSNWNDGPGTSPGNPGSRGGNSRDDNSSRPGQTCNGKNDSEKSWGGQDKSNSFAYVDLKLVDHHSDALGSGMEQGGAPAANDETDYYRRWVDVDLKVSRLRADSDRMPSWLDPAHGADIGALAHSTGGTGNCGGVDALSLVASSGACLKGFSGLKEGMTRLG
ncbi:MAG: putative Ig domain-containing protein [Sulfuricella sp.]